MGTVLNRMLYIYRVAAKLFCFILFGFGTLILIIFVFPCMSFFIKPKERFQRDGRRTVSATWHFFCTVMKIVKVTDIKVDNPAAYKNLRSKIIVANHPSLLDVVIIISLIPNANCIVNGALLKNIVGGVVRRLYISNTLDFETLCDECNKTLNEGNCLVIFPEGSRTPREGYLPLKRDAARLSILTGKPIIPIHIGGNDKYGLGKHEPLISFNRTEKYIYTIEVKEEISPQLYAGLPASLAARRITGDIEKAIF
ncbi:hypothetical protein AGMMS50212_04580 [Spirochaetia bacterium]|nr:hypothetical protein AGMMS50212_04580 [Spirochaetia bacterium]